MFEGVTIGGALLASSPWVLLAIGFFLLMTGHLVPRRTLTDMKEDRDAWRKVADVSETVRAEQTRQNNQMIAALETVEQVVRALPTRQQHGRGGR